MRVEIQGRVLDERYTRLLMQQRDLSLTQVILLDRVQKGRTISREEHKQLKGAGLVEGRYPSVIVAGSIARATGDAARHIAQRGFDKQYYLDLVLALLREHGPVTRAEIDRLLVPKLPDRLTEEQKRKKVENLVQELRRAGRIRSRRARGAAIWSLEPESRPGEPS